MPQALLLHAHPDLNGARCARAGEGQVGREPDLLPVDPAVHLHGGRRRRVQGGERAAGGKTLEFQNSKPFNPKFREGERASAAEAVRNSAWLRFMPPQGWTRVIVEKPFGRDSESFAQLEAELSTFLSEEQMYRIDHYLGKELIENLTVRGGAPSSQGVSGLKGLATAYWACMSCCQRLPPCSPYFVGVCLLAAPLRV